MRNRYKTIRQLAIAAALSTFTFQAMAQDDAAQLIKAGKEDANTLMNGYMGPFMKAFGAGLNSGWYQTAKPHGIGGFDLTISVNLPFAPTEDQSFDVSKLNALKLDASNGDKTTSPTIFGEASNGPKMNVVAANPAHTYFASHTPPGTPNPYSKDTTVTSFPLPQGLGVNFLPVPTAQFSIGVGFGTEVGIRFIPTITTENLSTGLFGFAIKHDFKQWIPGMKELPFDLSAMFGYTSFNLENKFTVEDSTAITPETGSDIQPDGSGLAYDNQKITMNSTAWTTNVIISKKLGPFTPYLGVGYQTSHTTLEMLGDYPVTSINTSYDPTAVPGSANSYAKKIETVSNPITIDPDWTGGLRANVGFRLKLLLLTIHADYTFATYNVASVGLGINLQSIVPFKL